MTDSSDQASISPLVDLIKTEIGKLLKKAGVEGADQSEELSKGLDGLIRKSLLNEELNPKEQSMLDSNTDFRPEFMDALLTARVEHVLEEVQNTIAAAVPSFEENLELTMVVARGDGPLDNPDGMQPLLTQLVNEDVERTLPVGGGADLHEGKIFLTNVGGADALQTVAFDGGATIAIIRPGENVPEDHTGPHAVEIGKALQELEKVVIAAAPKKQRGRLEASARAEDLTGALLGGKYRVGARLGRGGFGTVYRAKDIGPRQGNESEDYFAQVAIKVLNRGVAKKQKALDSFLEEAKRLVDLSSHPNIVRWITFDRTPDGLYYFVMELLEGEELEEVLKENKVLDPLVAASITLNVLGALGEVHDESSGKGALLHLDLKPQNIFLSGPLSPEGVKVKVIDFGISQHVQQQDFQTQLVGDSGTTGDHDSAPRSKHNKRGSTRTRKSSQSNRSGKGQSTLRAKGGTPTYSSPEQCSHLRGDRDIRALDGRSDIYSLGVVACKMLTGELPFLKPTTPAEAFRQHLEDPPRKIRDLNSKVPRRIARFVDKCLEKDPDARWSNATEAHEALLAASRPLVSKAMCAMLFVLAIVSGGLVYFAIQQNHSQAMGSFDIHLGDSTEARKVVDIDRGFPRELTFKKAVPNTKELSAFIENAEEKVVRVREGSSPTQAEIVFAESFEMDNGANRVNVIFGDGFTQGSRQFRLHPMPILEKAFQTDLYFRNPSIVGGHHKGDIANRVYLPESGAIGQLGFQLAREFGTWSALDIQFATPDGTLSERIMHKEHASEVFWFELGDIAKEVERLGLRRSETQSAHLGLRLFASTEAGTSLELEPEFQRELNLWLSPIESSPTILFQVANGPSKYLEDRWQRKDWNLRADNVESAHLLFLLPDDFLPTELTPNLSATLSLDDASPLVANSTFNPNVYAFELTSIIQHIQKETRTARIEFDYSCDGMLNWPESACPEPVHLDLTAKSVTASVLVGNKEIPPENLTLEKVTWTNPSQTVLVRGVSLAEPLVYLRIGEAAPERLMEDGGLFTSKPIGLTLPATTATVYFFDKEEIGTGADDKVARLQSDIAALIESGPGSDLELKNAWDRFVGLESSHRSFVLATASESLVDIAFLSDLPKADYWLDTDLQGLRVELRQQPGAAPLEESTRVSVQQGGLTVDLVRDPGSSAFAFPNAEIDRFKDDYFHLIVTGNDLAGNQTRIADSDHAERFALCNERPTFVFLSPDPTSPETAKWMPQEQTGYYQIRVEVRGPYPVQRDSVFATISETGSSTPGKEIALTLNQDTKKFEDLKVVIPDELSSKSITLTVRAKNSCGRSSVGTHECKLGKVVLPLKDRVTVPIGSMAYPLRLVHSRTKNYKFSDDSTADSSRVEDTFIGHERNKNFLLSTLEIPAPDLPDFYIGEHEVTNAEFRHFYDGNRNSALFQDGSRRDHFDAYFADLAPEDMDLAIYDVTWFEARGFANYLGLELPTALQWELALTTANNSRETEKRRYPNDLPCNYPLNAAKPSSLEQAIQYGDVTPNQIVGLAGNVSEWTCTGAWSEKAWTVENMLRPLIAPLDETRPHYVVVGSYFGEKFLVQGKLQPGQTPHDYRRKTSIHPLKNRVGTRGKKYEYKIGFRCARAKTETDKRMKTD